MSDSMPYADILILALIAGFILLRLRGVLGQKIGHDKPPVLRDAPEGDKDEPIVQLSEKVRARQEEEKQQDDALIAKIEDSAAREGIAAVKAADPAFTLRDFLSGARGAFEMVFDAFNKGEKQTLQMLLSQPLYEVFSNEYDRRRQEDKREETTLVSLESEEVTQASVERGKARIGVRFVSEQVSVIRNKDGAIIEGDPSATQRVEDEWVFERELSSRNPNWKIIDT